MLFLPEVNRLRKILRSWLNSKAGLVPFSAGDELGIVRNELKDMLQLAGPGYLVS